MTFISHAQNFEDVMLWRALRHVERGHYIDVGAAHPDEYSVTRAFYDRGWQGINIEPTSYYFRRLEDARQRDLNLNLAVGAEAGELPFFEIEGTGLSTLDLRVADKHRAVGCAVRETRVAVRTLTEIVLKHVSNDIHFLKIDVEGAERAVLLGANFSLFRPWIVLVEATCPLSTEQNHHEWENLLIKAEYRFAWFDGLNRFYIAAERWAGLSATFAVPPNVFDDFIRVCDTEQLERILSAESRATKSDLGIIQAERQLARAQKEIALAETHAVTADKRAMHAEARAAAAEDRAMRAEMQAIAAEEQAALARRQATELASRVATAEAAVRDACKASDDTRVYFSQIADDAVRERDLLRAATSWRVTAPLRVTALALPGSVRRHARRALKAVWWGLTPWRMPERIAFLREHRELRRSPALSLPSMRPTADSPSLYTRWIEAFEAFPEPPAGIRPLGVTQFSLLLPCVDEEQALIDSLSALGRQTNRDWEVVLPDTSNTRVAVTKASVDGRVVFVPCVAEERGATLVALLAAASGSWIGVLDAGDVLADRAFDCMAAAIVSEPQAALLYGDEDRLNASGQRVRPQFKPGWSPELLQAYNYFGRLTLLSRTLVESVGGFAPGLGAGVEWALNLRVADKAMEERRPIVRLPHVLCHRADTSEGDRPHPARRAASELRAALQAYWTDRGILKPRVSTQPDGTQRSSWDAVVAPLVSVIIPNRNSAALLRRCVTDVLGQTAYTTVEVLIVENGSDEPETFELYEQMKSTGRVRIVPFEDDFNYSAVCNCGAREARGSLLLFLNNDIEVEDPDWLGELVRVATLPGVGVVGTKLRYPTGEMQHAGVAVGPHLYGLMFHRACEEEWGVFGSSNHTRNWSAIMGACQMVTREVFDLVGGFDESYGMANSDVALCLRAARLGYRTAYTPFAALIHHEGASRGRQNPASDMERSAREVECLGIEEDPYFHPGLSGEDPVPRLRDPSELAVREVLRRNLASVLVTPRALPLDLYDDGAVLGAAGTNHEAVFWPARSPGVIQDQWAAARWILDLLRMRADLRARFPRALSEGVEGYFASWLAGPARSEIPIPDGLAAYLDTLFSGDFDARVRQVYFDREDVRKPNPLGTLPPGRRLLVSWLFAQGRTECKLRTEEIWWFLLSCAEVPAAELVRLYRFTPDWQRAHPAGLTVFGRGRFAAWLAKRYDLPNDTVWLDPAVWPGLPGPAEQLRLAYAANKAWWRTQTAAFRTPESAQSLLEWLAAPSTGLPLEQREWCTMCAKGGLARSATGLGVNVIGHFCYPSGLRSSVEAMCDALEGAGVVVSRRDVRTDQNDDPYHARFGGLESQDVTIIHSQPEPFFAEIYARADLAPRRPRPYRIAYWYWELDTVPSHWADMARGVDEVWTATSFVGDALRRVVDVPVHVLLPGVRIEPFTSRDRAIGTLGRRKGRFAFLFSFHMASITERKNPLALVRAFCRAFDPEEPVDLILKTTSDSRHKTELDTLREAASECNVTVIDAVFTREETLALMNDCDAYISLHRSEGLGLTMAEAMLLGKPVIATRYSGNLDFMNDANSLLVDYDLVTLDRDIPPYPTGAHWAEPSIEHAARLMRRLYDDRNFATALGHRARDDASQILSLEAAGARFATRLAEIKPIFDSGRRQVVETQRQAAPRSWGDTPCSDRAVGLR